MVIIILESDSTDPADYALTTTTTTNNNNNNNNYYYYYYYCYCNNYNTA